MTSVYGICKDGDEHGEDDGDDDDDDNDGAVRSLTSVYGIWKEEEEEEEEAVRSLWCREHGKSGNMMRRRMMMMQ